MKTNMMKNIRNWSAILAMAGAALTGCNAGPEELNGVLAVSPNLETTEQAIVYGGHDYLFVKTPSTWDQAQAYCGQNGYNLVTINDTAEESFLHTQEGSQSSSPWWIGYNDRGLEGTWTWVHSTSGYTNWAVGEPNNSNGWGSENCAVDRWNGSLWNDEDCNNLRPFICERDPAPQTSNGTCVYTANNTSNATMNTVNCSVKLYKDMTFSVGTCGVPGASRSGDTFLRLNGPSGTEIASNNDAGGVCGTGSNFSLIIPMTGTYNIRAGCSGSGSCGGTVAYTY